VTGEAADRWWFHRRWSDFRRGSLRIAVEWEGTSAEATLFDEGAPRTAAGVAGALPLELPVVHVAWSGEMLMGTTTVDIGVAGPENDVRLVRPGDLTYDPKFGELGFVYGDAECRLPSGPNTVVVFGALAADRVDEFAAWARRRRFEGVGTLRLAPSR
jgi:hypothetical protein